MRIDLKKERRHLYAPPTTGFVTVEVPPTRYLAIDGHGDPNTSEDYVSAVQSLYTAGYAIRAAVKARCGSDFVVGPLEGLWSSTDPGVFASRAKERWDWTMLIPLPEQLVVDEDVETGLVAAARKKPTLPVGSVRDTVLSEGTCLQIMHIGAYDDETETLASLHHEVMPGLGLTWNGPHHEIYLSDPRRCPEDRLRTILRQPVRPVQRAGG